MQVELVIRWDPLDLYLDFTDILKNFMLGYLLETQYVYYLCELNN